MTMTRSEQHGHGPQKKGLRNFHEKLDLNKSSLQQPDVQWQLLDTEKHKRSVAGLAEHSQYGQVVQSTEKYKGNFSKEAQLDKKPVANHVDLGVDHLLILAQSAEMVAESENSFSVMHTNHQNKGSNNILVEQLYPDNISNATAVDQESSQEVHDETSLDSHLSGQRSGFSYEVTRPRLTQIRKQARTKYLFLDKENIEDSQCSHWHLHKKPIRLSQIKHQARCQSKNNLLTQEMIIENNNEQPQRRLVRMSQVKHLARYKGKSTAEEGTGNHKDGHLHCKQFGDNKREKVVKCKLTKEAICQQEGNQIGVASAKAQKNTQLKENSQGRVSSSESSRIKHECHQHVPNTLPMQNNVLHSSFTNSPNKIFLHSETNMSWLSHMHSLQLTDYYGILARQWRAERIERKRASKDKHQNSNSPMQHEAASGGELHHTQLKENYHCIVARQHRAELMKRKRASKNMHQYSKNPVLGKGASNDKLQYSENPVQYKAASGEELHSTLLEEDYHLVVARQRRAERIEKRASKHKHQCSENPVQQKAASVRDLHCTQLKEGHGSQHSATSWHTEANYDRQKEFTSVKEKIRLSQLRREARIGNQCHARS